MDRKGSFDALKKPLNVSKKKKKKETHRGIRGDRKNIWMPSLAQSVFGFDLREWKMKDCPENLQYAC